MKIGVLGAGLIGGALAKLATDRGHEVRISSRHPDASAELAAEIGCRTGTLDHAASFGELCLLAVPLVALDSLPAAPLAGKVVIVQDS